MLTQTSHDLISFRAIFFSCGYTIYSFIDVLRHLKNCQGGYGEHDITALKLFVQQTLYSDSSDLI